MRRLLFGLALVMVAVPPTFGEFPLKDGDVWVLAGDSITAQHLHSNYFEAFCHARYPNIKFAFRNSGVGGHTIPTTLARFDYDIAAWKPTVVSVELGMNDQGGTLPAKFIDNMNAMVERIRGIKARPVIFSASPINNGDTMAKLSGNKRLHEYALALKDFCAKEQLPYADQFHALVDPWGNNKPSELLANAFPILKQLAQNDQLAGVEQLRAFLSLQEKGATRPVSMLGDPVHPGPTGQLMMAAAILKELGAVPFVSSATVSSEGKVLEAKGCKIDNVAASDGKLVFERFDECLPFPIADDARPVLSVDPTILEMSQYTLKVIGLKGGSYSLKINGNPIATLPAKQLEGGINLAAFSSTPQPKSVNPIAAQGKEVLAAVSARAGLVGQWRGLSKAVHAPGAAPELRGQLEMLTTKVEQADQKIRDAARPRLLRFELESSQ